MLGSNRTLAASTSVEASQTLQAVMLVIRQQLCDVPVAIVLHRHSSKQLLMPSFWVTDLGALFNYVRPSMQWSCFPNNI